MLLLVLVARRRGPDGWATAFLLAFRPGVGFGVVGARGAVPGGSAVACAALERCVSAGGRARALRGCPNSCAVHRFYAAYGAALSSQLARECVLEGSDSGEASCRWLSVLRRLVNKSALSNRGPKSRHRFHWASGWPQRSIIPVVHPSSRPGPVHNGTALARFPGVGPRSPRGRRRARPAHSQLPSAFRHASTTPPRRHGTVGSTGTS